MTMLLEGEGGWGGEHNFLVFLINELFLHCWTQLLSDLCSIWQLITYAEDDLSVLP